MSKGYFRQTSIYGVALLAERILSLCLIPVLVKVISPIEYGIWVQSIVVTGVLVPIVAMGFQTAIVKFFPIWDENLRLRDSVLLAMISAIVVLLAVVSAIAVGFPDFIASGVFGQSAHVSYVPLLIVLLISEVLFEILVSILRATGRIRFVALYIFIKGFLRIGSPLVVLYGMGGSFYNAFLAFVLIQFLFVTLILVKDIPFRRILYSGITTGSAQWRVVMSFSLPLVALAVMTGLNSFTDRFFLSHLHGLGVVAVYAATYSLAALTALFSSVLGFTLFPALAEFWAKGRRNDAAELFRRAILVFLFFLCPFAVGMAVSGQDVLIMLTTEEYKAPATLGLLLTCNIGLLGLYQFAFYVVLLDGGSARCLRLMVFAAGLNVLLNALLVPVFGMIGAALSGLASNTLLAGITLQMAGRILSGHLPWAPSLRILLRAGTMGLLLWLMIYWFDPDHVIGLLSVLFVGGLFYMALDFLDQKTSLFILLKSL